MATGRNRALIALSASMGVFILFATICAGGGVWSDTSFKSGSVTVTVKWGLGTVSIGGITITFDSAQIDDLAMTMPYDDFKKLFPGLDTSHVDNAVEAGATCSAFLALGMIFGVIGWAMISMYSSDKCTRFTKYAPIVMFLFAGFAVIPWTVWKSVGHEDGAGSFLKSVSSSKLGWSYYVYASLAWPPSIVAFICTLVLYAKGPDPKLKMSAAQRASVSARGLVSVTDRAPVPTV